MIINIGNGVDESVVKWKYNDKDKWRDADIDDLIHLYESVVHCKDCRHAYFKDFDKYCRRMVGALKPNQFCSFGELAEKVECSKCKHKETCEDAYTENSQYCNGELAEQTEIPMFKESAEAYKKWTGDDIGKWQNEIGVEKRLEDYHGKPTLTKPHGRLIDGDELKNTIENMQENMEANSFGRTEPNANDILYVLDDMLNRFSFGRPHGEWYQIKDHKIMGEGYLWHCSICDYKVYQDSSKDYPTENFCPNCGADMRGDNNDE